ncbi:MAG: arginine--tRNA ligase [Patescibacteria group bacterium]|nr:MAG: arginine--tRNA ligase [Patescibacteria group bacterium]
MEITNILKQSILAALKDMNISATESEVLIEYPADPTHGDFASNVAMTLFGRLKRESGAGFQFTTPREFALTVTDNLNNQKIREVSTIAVAGPGFINFTISDAFLLSKMGLIIQNRGNVVEQFGNGKKIVAEYSSPNIAKPFTVGHLRSTIIGDSLANIFESCGYTVFRDNHLGDWGTQFGKQIYAIKTWGDEAQIEAAENPVKELVKLYVKFHEEAEKDPSIEDQGRAWFKKLEKGDAEARRLWEKCINWSWKEFEKIYTVLNVSFTENNGRGYGESFFEDKMGAVIAELKDKGILQESKGAQLVFFPEDKYPPLMILKNDGSTLYSTRDLATDKFRLEKYGSDIVIFNEVGSEQSLYFQQLFEIENMLGWYKDGQRVHVGHGLIRFADKKMSTRKGNVIWLEDVLSEAYSRVETMSKELETDSIWKIAVGALKWNDLKRKMNLPMVFDWDELTNIKGNSGPYMQYTFVRCLSVLNKAQNEVFQSFSAEEKSLKSELENDNILNTIILHYDTLLNSKSYLNHKLNKDEKDVLRNLNKYSDIVKSSALEFAPHHIANYLYELAQSFNTFYANHKIITEDSKATDLRLLLVVAVAYTIQHGLGLLGIRTVEKM